MKAGLVLAGVLLLLAMLAPHVAAQEPKQYKLGPDSLPQEGVPKGKLEGPFLFKSQVLANTIRKYWIYIPAQYFPEKPASVLVFQDGQRAMNPNGVVRVRNVLDNLIHKREIPVTIGILITPGHRGEEYPETLGFSNPNNRSVEYDSLGDAYARFVVDEMLPEVGKRYTLTTDPSERAIGSFTNLRGGHVYAELVRKSERKPIRVFIQDGLYDNRDPANPERDWYLQNQAMVAALKEKGYDFEAVFGEGSHSDTHGGAILPDILRWLWRDYKK